MACRPQAFAAMLVYLAAAASLASGAVACCRKPRQVSLQRVTFSAWAVAEAVMGAMTNELALKSIQLLEK